MIRYWDENDAMNDTWGERHGHWHDINNTVQVIGEIVHGNVGDLKEFISSSIKQMGGGELNGSTY